MIRVKQPHLTSRQLFPEYNHNWNCDTDFIQQVNKQLQLSHLHFRCNIDCFCSVSAAKIVKQRSAEPSSISQQLVFSLLYYSAFWNESVDLKIQWSIHKHLSQSWMTQSLERIIWTNESMTRSLRWSPGDT